MKREIKRGGYCLDFDELCGFLSNLVWLFVTIVSSSKNEKILEL